MPIIDAISAGAVLLASNAMSMGAHMKHKKRLDDVENNIKVHSVELTALEIFSITSAVGYLVDRHRLKKIIKRIENDQNDMINEVRADYAAINDRLNNLNLDTLVVQGQEINNKVDKVQSTLDIAIIEEEDDK